MEQKKSVSIIYERKKGALTFPCSGAYGGPSPDGNGIIVHMFIEYNSVPYSTEIEIVNQRMINPEKGRTVTRGDLTREIQSTVFMSAESAIVIGNWLVDKGKLLLERKKIGGPDE